MFEPIRDDLQEVEREFARHIQSQVVELIPTIASAGAVAVTLSITTFRL